VPVMKDLTQKVRFARAQPFSEELDDVAPLVYEKDGRDEKERGDGFHVPYRTTADVERPFDDNRVEGSDEGGEGRAPQTMPKVLRGVPSRKIPVKKSVVRGRRRGEWGGERESTVG